MVVDPIERLRAANPECGCPPPSFDEVWRRIESGARVAPRLVPRRRGLAALGSRARPLSGVVLVLSSVVVVVAVVAIALLAHGRGTTAGSSQGAKQLIAKLAVLRRAQTAADRLPGDLRIRSPLSPQGKVVPQLTRLVRTLPYARFYLVVTTWSPDSVWSPRLGDQVGIVEVSGGHATESMPVPAADLTNATEVSYVTPARTVASQGAFRFPYPGSYLVGVVPDGVARVRWTFSSRQFKPGAVLNVPVADNAAITKARRDTTPPVLRGSWYDPDGQSIPTSDHAFRAAWAARDAEQKAQLIHVVLEHPYHASRSVLNAFAVFAINSRTGVKTAAGNIVSRPPLSSLPLPLLQGWARPGRGLDFMQVREVITPSGAHLYVIPGGQNLCVVTVFSSTMPNGLPTGGGGGGCNDLGTIESNRGMQESGGSPGVSYTYEIVPKNVHRIVVPNNGGKIVRVAVPDGIYFRSSKRTGNGPISPAVRNHLRRAP